MTKQTLIQGASIIDGTGAPPVSGSVLIEGEVIKTVTEGDDLPTHDPAAQVIPAHGMCVMPGLIDAHCHVTFDEPASNDELFMHRREGLAALIAARNVRKLLTAGVTSFLDADCIFDVGIDLRDAIEAGIVEGPRMATGGNALLTAVGGTAGRFIPDAGRSGYAQVVRSKAELVNEVRRQIKYGVDWIKVHVTGLIPRRMRMGEVQVFTFEELKLICDTAHDLGTPVVGHCRNPQSIRDSANAGFDLILHATFMDEESFDAVVENQVPIAPTFTFQANLADYGDKVGASPELRDIFRKEIESSSAMLRRIYDAGVPLLCGTETGFSLTPYGDWHYREMQVFVEALGMTPLQAIQCATQAGAFTVGLEGQVGTVADGMLADLLLIDGDPASDVTVLGDRDRLKGVFLGGRQVDLTDRSLPRKPIAGWRVVPYSNDILTRERAAGQD